MHGAGKINFRGLTGPVGEGFTERFQGEQAYEAREVGRWSVRLARRGGFGVIRERCEAGEASAGWAEGSGRRMQKLRGDGRA